jgi:arylsulfatase A-like enzyme
MQRRDFIKLASLGAAATAVPAAALDAATGSAAPVRKPNIIFIVSDQHRVGLTKREGYPLDTSPALDRLAANGVAFDRAYCASPLCVPSRTTMLTGRWPEATHVRSNDMIADAFYPTHLYKVAKDNGYKTGLTGKNHTFLKKEETDFWRMYELANGWIAPDAPQAYHDFEKYLQSLHANVGLVPTPFPVELQHPYRIVSDAMEFIEGAGEQPFLIQVGFSEPHDPEQVPAPYFDMFPPDKIHDRCAGPEALKELGYRAQWLYGHQEDGFPTEKNWRRYKSNYLGMLRLIDDQLARLVAFLDKKNLTKDTIVIYLADHGDYLMDYGLGRKGVGLPECLARIPMVWSGAGIKPSRVGSSAHVSNVDFFPTLCEAIGVSIPHGVQGRSLWPLLQGQDYPREEFRSIYATSGLGGMYYEASDNVPFNLSEPGRAAVVRNFPATAGYDELNKVTQSGLQKMVRMGDWKLIFDMMGYGQLYHLPSDPCERKNLFGHPTAAKDQAELMAELLMWTIRAQDNLPTGTQGIKYQTKWPGDHNWYAPYRHGTAPEAFIP